VTAPQSKWGIFIGDFVKREKHGGAIRKRNCKRNCSSSRIDWYTDRHPVVKQSKERLRPKYRHYSGVITDIFLIIFWREILTNISERFLPDFADDCYSIIQQHDTILPDEVKYMMPYMIKGNWLVNLCQNRRYPKSIKWHDAKSQV